MSLVVNPPLINYSWPYLRYVGLLGFPLSIVLYRRMLRHRGDPDETVIDIGLKWRLVFIHGFTATLLFAEACLCVWQLIGRT